MKIHQCTFFLTFFILSQSVTFAGSSGDTSDLAIRETGLTFFAGSMASIHVTTRRLPALAGAVVWRIHWNNRTMAQGSAQMINNTAELKIPLPAAEEGVMIQADLTLIDSNNTFSSDQPLLSEKIYIYPANAFSQKKKFLTDLKIGIYDPPKTTQSLFDKIGLPFQTYPNIESIPFFEGKLFIVGQNLDIGTIPALWDALNTLLARGVPVLVLAPHKGRIKLADNTDLSSDQSTDRIFLYRESIIRDLDKYLDIHWAPEGKTSISGIKIFTEEKEIFGQVGPEPENWPWVEVIRKNGGRMIICGFDFAGTMEQSPAPRYFLSRLIEYLVNPYDKEAVK